MRKISREEEEEQSEEPSAKTTASRQRQENAFVTHTHSRKHTNTPHRRGLRQGLARRKPPHHQQQQPHHHHLPQVEQGQEEAAEEEEERRRQQQQMALVTVQRSPSVADSCSNSVSVSGSERSQLYLACVCFVMVSVSVSVSRKRVPIRQSSPPVRVPLSVMILCVFSPNVYSSACCLRFVFIPRVGGRRHRCCFWCNPSKSVADVATSIFFNKLLHCLICRFCRLSHVWLLLFLRFR